MEKFPVHNRPIDFSSVELTAYVNSVYPEIGKELQRIGDAPLESTTARQLVTQHIRVDSGKPMTATEAMLRREEAAMHMFSMYGFPDSCLGTCQPQRSSRRHVDSRVINKPKLLT